MKKTILLMATCALMGTAAAQDIQIKKGKVTMTEAQYNELRAKADAYDKMIAAPAKFNDSASYAIGRDIFKQWDAQQLGIDGHFAGLAMIECAAKQSRLDDAAATPLLQRFQQEFELRNNAAARENIRKGEEYMRQISNNKSVYTTKSGLKYRRVKEGNGKRPKATDKVKVHYTGKLIDGKVFDSSIQRKQPVVMQVTQLVPGFTEALLHMPVGSEWEVVIPQELAYGENGSSGIEPYSTLIFTIKLLGIEK